MKKALVLVILLTMALSIVGCSNSKPASPAATGSKEVKIGIVLPLTGFVR